MLNVILGEWELDTGTLTINAAEEAWVFADSLRNDISFVEDFDEQRYNKGVNVCCKNAFYSSSISSAPLFRSIVTTSKLSERNE